MLSRCCTWGAEDDNPRGIGRRPGADVRKVEVQRHERAALGSADAGQLSVLPAGELLFVDPLGLVPARRRIPAASGRFSSGYYDKLDPQQFLEQARDYEGLDEQR